MRRLKMRQLSLQYVREYYLLHDLSLGAGSISTRSWSQPPPADQHRPEPPVLLLRPGAEHRPGRSWASRRRSWLCRTCRRRSLGGPDPGHRADRGRSPPPPRSSLLYQVVVMGLGTMALEILVLVLYQIRLGSLYQQLGMLIAAFMAGMAAGSAAGFHWTGGPGALRLPRALLQGAWRSWPYPWPSGCKGVSTGGCRVGVLDPGGTSCCWRRRASAAAGSLPQAPRSGIRSSRRPGGRAAGFMRLTCWALPWGPWGQPAGAAGVGDLASPLVGGLSPCRGRGDGTPDPEVQMTTGRRPPAGPKPPALSRPLKEGSGGGGGLVGPGG